MLSITFDWATCCPAHDKLTLKIPEATLATRDPNHTSLLSAKLSFLRGQLHGVVNEFGMSPAGPGEDEYMTPALIQFIWAYLTDETTAVPPELDPVDCVNGLSFFGFPDVKVVIPASDPRRVGKQLALNVYLEGLAAVASIVAFVEKTCACLPWSARCSLLV